MSPHSNLSEHLIECLNVVCGRFVREGEEIGNPGFIFRREGLRAQVDSPTRSWEHGPRTRTGGYGPIGGEMATGVLADERSEEHTSELQSLMRISYAVFCLKKKKNNQ